MQSISRARCYLGILKLKLNPLILGSGVKLFGESGKSLNLELLETDSYDEGLQIMTYKIKY